MSTATSAPPQNAPSGPSDPSRGGSHRRRRPRNSNRPPAPQEEAHTPAEPSRGAHSGSQVPNRGQRRGRGRGRGHTTASQETREASAPPTTQTTPSPAPAPSRRGRGGRRGGQNPRFPIPATGGRQFGGQLTVEDNAVPAPGNRISSGSSLQADAPEFQPGRPIIPQKQRPRQAKPQAPKSTAPDIATRIHEDVNNGHYECAICTEELRRHSKVWSCRTCWTVFHLSCIKKWASNEGSAAARQQAPEGELPPPRQWRCPGCNLPKDVQPKTFSCWCEKELDPKPLPGLPPFSCGQTCARPRLLPKKCPHPCPVTCHAGSCPPCTLMGPTQRCFCGKKSVTRLCKDTEYDEGWSCGAICGQLMPCGEHYCDQACHNGPCGACEVRIPARCYCGQVEKDILCCEKGERKDSQVSHLASDDSVNEHWTGLFDCQKTCGRTFDCGRHTCEKQCHPQDSALAHCPRSPEVVFYCPCGKTPLSEISAVARQSCEDPIPNCTKPCRKTLDCGHECQQLCHQDECMACLRVMSMHCRCGRNAFSTICHQGADEPPHCMRVCRVSLNCGRHECGERCCPGERKAAERQSTRRKPRPLDSAPRRVEENFEAEHICTRTCGRQLRCGNPDHRCQELCHKGPCGSCREAIFEEVSCHCGRTVLQPPLPCGTQPPPCRFACERPKACGHPQVAHECHQDNESCPKCPFQITKTCLCGKNSLKHQPCWLTEVRCGEICGRRLKCGAHYCQKQCHRPGECEEPCRQPCGKELSVCGHPCLSPCHSPVPCKEDKPCSHKIFVTCDCQRIKQEAKCNASKTSEGNLKKTLKCDDECARLERNHKLAMALNVDPATRQDDHVPYSAETIKMYQENAAWATTQEKALRLFAADPEERRLRFKPMQRHQRAFLHHLAEDFGFDHESMDPEPHRHIAIFKTPRFVMAPMKTLAESARIQYRQKSTAPPPPTSTMQSRPKPSNTTGDPYNSFLITDPRFALTVEEVTAAVKDALPKTSFPLELEVHFLPSEAVGLKPPLAARVNIAEREIQTMLESIKPTLSQVIASEKIGKLQLARLDSSLNILRKEADAGGGGGWSQVAAAKGAPVRKTQQKTPVGTRGGFAVLSLNSTKKKKEKEQAEVVEDWEAAEEKEEEKEKASGANSGVTSDDEAPARKPEELSIDNKPNTARWADMDDMDDYK